MENITEEKVDLSDVQGLIIKGYGSLPHACFLLLHFNNPTAAKIWLGDLELTDSKTSSLTISHAKNIAFTHEGLVVLGITKDVSKTFSREFEEGMVTPHRQRILYDFGESDPLNWNWGKPSDEKPVHASLLIYGKTEDILNEVLSEEKERLALAEVDIKQELDSGLLPENKEHFGFRDGIAQPVIKNADRNEEKEHPANLINPGEFIFGYINEYDKYIESPTISKEEDPDNLLEQDKNDPTRKDLGRNGSMMVFRQMQQDVVSFWKFMDEAASNQKADYNKRNKEALAAKMVGRWPDGSPLVKCPVSSNPEHGTFDNFGYAEKDFDGHKCPIGSHIRRANPRDNLVRNSKNPKHDREESEKVMKRFRIIRRGRPYGKPISTTMNPDEIINSGETDKNRGIHFICFNTSIGRQFELIQQTWINNPKFAGLYDDPDPIVGDPAIMGNGATGTFTEQAFIRKKVYGVPRFITVKGGAYFFMPGIKGVKFLAKL